MRINIELNTGLNENEKKIIVGKINQTLEQKAGEEGYNWRMFIIGK